MDPREGISRPAIRRSNDVLPDPLGPTTASASPEVASKLRLEKTSRPPRTQPTSRPESRILPLREPQNLGVPHQNLWVARLANRLPVWRRLLKDSISRNL